MRLSSAVGISSAEHESAEKEDLCTPVPMSERGESLCQSAGEVCSISEGCFDLMLLEESHPAGRRGVHLVQRSIS